jgi:hypothetical protein
VIPQTFSKLYRATSKKTIPFIVAIVRTSNPATDQNEVDKHKMDALDVQFKSMMWIELAQDRIQ